MYTSGTCSDGVPWRSALEECLSVTAAVGSAAVCKSSTENWKTSYMQLPVYTGLSMRLTNKQTKKEH